MPSLWSGFYKKAIKERQAQLRLAYPALFADKAASPPNRPFPLTPITDEVADNMIENCVGTIGLPIGLALNFSINGESLVVPMVVEEPSVVAAVSGAAKTISNASLEAGFCASTSDRNIIYAQIQLLDIADPTIDIAYDCITAQKDAVLRIANEHCASMQKRGGGALDMTVRKIRRSRPVITNGCTMSYWLVVHIHIDVCDAMGANCASSVAEGVAPFLSELSGARIGFRIVSNLSVERTATSRFRIPTSKLAYKGLSGDYVAARIVESYEWACDDPFRAVTNNKGIMNGIDAVAVATGQDWRAIESSAHAWASSAAGNCQSSTSPYSPLSKYWVEQSDSGESLFCGEMTLPICVGTSGGVLKTNPVYHYTLGLMGHPNSKKLAMILVCVGLAQNFAALRALSTEGIQRGHMSLHARNIAIAAGAPAHAIQECVTYMVECGRITSVAATEYLAAHRLQSQIKSLVLSADEGLSKSSLPNGNHHEEPSTRGSRQLSMFCFEQMPTSSGTPNGVTRGNEERTSLNIAFASFTEKPVHMMLMSSSNSARDPLVTALFGDKTFEWINAVPGFLKHIKLNSVAGGDRRSNLTLSSKLRLLSVLLNILARRLLSLHPKETAEFLGTVVVLAKSPHNSLSEIWSTPSGKDVQENVHINGKSDDRYQHLSNLGLFQRDAYDALDGVRSRSDSETLRVGIPLFLAIWQVFHYRVVQWVGDATLALDLLDEQRHIIESLSSIIPISRLSSPNSDTQLPIEDIERLFNLHSQRFQAHMFLLCDSISLDVPLETYEQRAYMRALGQKLEREQAIAHDLCADRLQRDIEIIRTSGLSIDGDLTTGVVNVFLTWLHLVKGWSLEHIINIPSPPAKASDFFGLRKEMLDYVKEVQIFSHNVPIVDDTSVASKGLPPVPSVEFNNVVRQYRTYYNVGALFE